MPRTVKLHKTAVFKVHNPSAAKRRVLDLVFARYGEAYNGLLEACKPLAESWLATAQDTKRLPSLRRAMKQMYPLCPGARGLDLPSSLRDGLLSDVAGNLLSHCRLRLEWERKEKKEKQGEPNYPAPVYGYRREAYFEALAQAVSWAGTDLDFIAFQERLTREAKQVVRPLSFCRARDFKLERLHNERWGVTLNLQPRTQQPNRLRFPLAFGEWHEETYLEQGTPRCAHLCRREGEYFLHVAFEFAVEVMEASEAQCLLGIDRGIVKQAAYALTDLEGKLLEVGSLGREQRELQIVLGRRRQAAQKAGRRVTVREWQRRRQEENLHLIVNAVVKLAAAHKALVVMEDLNLHNAGRFVRSQYAKLAKILDYKLTQAGLPRPKEVFAAFSSKICSKCGEEGQRERESSHCPACGVELDADENAAVNIARRPLYRKTDWKGDYRAFHRSFSSV